MFVILYGPLPNNPQHIDRCKQDLRKLTLHYQRLEGRSTGDTALPIIAIEALATMEAILPVPCTGEASNPCHLHRSGSSSMTVPLHQGQGSSSSSDMHPTQGRSSQPGEYPRWDRQGDGPIATLLRETPLIKCELCPASDTSLFFNVTLKYFDDLNREGMDRRKR